MKTEMTAEYSNETDKLKRFLLIALVVLPCFVLSAMLLSSSLNNKKVLLNEARTLLKNTTTESKRHTENFLLSAEKQVVLGAKLAKNNVLSAGNIEALEDYFISQLEVNPNIAGIYSANTKGGFFFVSRSTNLDKGKYRVKVISINGELTTSTIWWRNPGSEKNNTTVLPDDDYDPRTRPWFIETQQSKNPVWTEPYIFFTTQRLGITTARFLEDSSGQDIGAVGVDLEIIELAKFLSELSASRYGESFITTSEGLLIASPSLYDQYKNSTDYVELKISNITDSNNELAKRAYAAVLNDEEESKFEFNKQKYLVESMQLKLSDDKSWLIDSYSNENEFLTEIRKSELQKYIFAALIALFSVILAWFLARNSWKPIDRLEDKANRDQLTNLYNRRRLDLKAVSMVTRSLSLKQPLSIAIIDIDHFKPVNDTYGHDVGDQILKAFASRLLNQKRPLDLLARFGGEEFVLVMPNTTAELAQSIVDNERVAMSNRPYDVDGITLKISFSAGVAELHEDLNTYNLLMKAADKALYRSKEHGRNQVSIFDPIDVQELTLVMTGDFPKPKT